MIGAVLTTKETLVEVVNEPPPIILEGLLIKLVPDKTTAPFLANNLPSIDEPVFIVIDVKASIFPLKVV